MTCFNIAQPVNKFVLKIWKISHTNLEFQLFFKKRRKCGNIGPWFWQVVLNSGCPPGSPRSPSGLPTCLITAILRQLQCPLALEVSGWGTVSRILQEGPELPSTQRLHLGQQVAVQCREWRSF